LAESGLPFEMDSARPASALGASFLVLVIALPVAVAAEHWPVALAIRSARSSHQLVSGIWEDIAPGTGATSSFLFW